MNCCKMCVLADHAVFYFVEKTSLNMALFPLLYCHITLEKSIFSGSGMRITTQRNMKVFPKSARQAQHVARRTFST